MIMYFSPPPTLPDKKECIEDFSDFEITKAPPLQRLAPPLCDGKQILALVLGLLKAIIERGASRGTENSSRLTCGFIALLAVNFSLCQSRHDRADQRLIGRRHLLGITAVPSALNKSQSWGLNWGAVLSKVCMGLFPAPLSIAFLPGQVQTLT